MTAADEGEGKGDHWDTNCLAPQSKSLVSLVPGKRTRQTIHQVVADAAQRLAPDAMQPALSTDGEPTHPEAILAAFGHPYQPPRRGEPGCPPALRVRVPQDLVFAQVIKHRQGYRIRQVEVRPVFGKGKLPQVVAQLGWNKANTSAIKRFNLTDRLRNGRKVRKTMGFSRRTQLLDAMGWISALRYNFHHPHRTLRLCTPEGHWQKRTPAMAAGLTDQIHTALELM